MKTIKLMLVLLACMAFGASSYAQGGCNDYRYYYADIATNGVTDVYQVTLVGGDADLTPLVVSQDEVHVALSETSKLLYLVRKSDGAISIVDPLAAVPAMGAWNLLTPSVSGVVTAVFDANGDLIIGSESLDELYMVDPAFNASPIDTYSPVDGGDIAYDAPGDLYLASGTDLYKNEIFPTPDVLIGTLNNLHLSTGLARTLNGDFISSYLGSDVLLLHNSSATLLASYNLKLNNLAFTSNYGDMAAGCMQPPPVEVDCEPFSTFYIQHGPGVVGSDLYHVNFNGPNADLTFEFNVPFEAHIAFDPMTDVIFMIDKTGTNITHYNHVFNSVTAIIPIVPPLSGITTVVFDEVSQMLIVGDMNQDIIYTLDPVLGTHAIFGNANVSGGDLAIKDSIMYLASRSGNSFYEFLGAVPQFKGNMVTDKVNGLAQANNATGLITSNNGSTDFIEIDANGATVATFAAMLNSVPFTLLNGDMAAGCSGGGAVIGCSDYRYYYIADNTPGVPEGRVFSGQIIGNDFVLTPFFDSGNSGHMAVSEITGNIYVTHSSGTNIKTFNQNGVLQLTAPLAGLNSITALVWHKANQQLYVGNAQSNEVYTVDPTNGNLTLFAGNLPVNGGDLISTDNNKLLLVERVNTGPSKVYDITAGTANYLYDVSNYINGAALTLTGDYIMSEGDNSVSFHTYTAGGVAGPVLNSVDNNSNPFPLFDGDMASACFDAIPPAPAPKVVKTSAIIISQLSSYPNPTTGIAEVSFTSSSQGPALLQVQDMRGKNLATLYNSSANKGELYRIQFNGNALPNGMYIYKLTTANEVLLEKFIIIK